VFAFWELLMAQSRIQPVRNSGSFRIATVIVGLIAPGEHRASGKGNPFFTRMEHGPPMNPFSFARRFEA
jgi:hypothetical protein